MRAERKTVKWEEVEVLKCEFCGDVYEDCEDNPLNVIVIPRDGYSTKWVCEFCLARDPAPKYPSGMREIQE